MCVRQVRRSPDRPDQYLGGSGPANHGAVLQAAGQARPLQCLQGARAHPSLRRSAGKDQQCRQHLQRGCRAEAGRFGDACGRGARRIPGGGLQVGPGSRSAIHGPGSAVPPPGPAGRGGGTAAGPAGSLLAVRDRGEEAVGGRHRCGGDGSRPAARAVARPGRIAGRARFSGRSHGGCSARSAAVPAGRAAVPYP